MARLWILAAVFTATGCLSQRPSFKVEDAQQERAVYGDVPIIRPGMTLNDVDKLMGSTRAGFSRGDFNFMTWVYPDGLRVDGDWDKVDSCDCGESTVFDADPNPPLCDAHLETKLIPNLSPADVETVAGSPAFGVGNPQGTVQLAYRKLGIVVEYADGRLVRWWRNVVYRNPPAKDTK